MKKCPKCGEESDAQFDSCWRCQTRFNEDISDDEIPDEMPVDALGASAGKSGSCWLASLLIPIAVVLLGVLIAVGIPRNEHDWFGIVPLVTIALFLVVSVVVSLVLAGISISRGEKRALFAAIGSAFYLGAFGIVTYLSLNG